jgi:predicted 3-demethylubiquinone-9 3-methyltransferase (glyoxalase superfamily)
MQTIVPHLWFDDEAEEAAQFYCSLFDDSSVGRVQRYGKAGFEVHGRPEGSVMTVEFELDGFEMIALNGGPHFSFTPAISLFVVLETADEVDAMWAELSEGGEVLMPLDAYPWSERYGWLNDRYGLSWQITLSERPDMGGQSIAPSLLFVGDHHGEAEEAINHYVSTFPDSEVGLIMRNDGSGVEPEGTVQFAQFDLDGEGFMALDSALEHDFGFNEAVSFLVRCDTQDEIDRYWEALSADPEAERCGWLKDRFGVSWQIVPTALPELLGDDQETSDRVMKALLGMKKLDLARLEEAAS